MKTMNNLVAVANNAEMTREHHRLGFSVCESIAPVEIES